MAILLATFPGLEARPAALRIWFGILEDLKNEDFSRGITEICRTEKQIYPGTNVVALIRDRAGGDVQSEALRALLLVEESVFRIGAYVSPEFSDPRITLTIYRLGGWEKICLMDRDEWKFVRRDFERIYRDLSTRGMPEEIPRLVGTLERCNAFSAPGTEPTIVRIGNPSLENSHLGRAFLPEEGKGEVLKQFAPEGILKR
jgi:hypothetical protein